MQKFPSHWDLKTKIEFLQRKVILNSIAYYLHDTNFLSDKFYDDISRQLVQLCREYGDVSDTKYGYAMVDFDGTTGFDLYYRLTEDDREYLEHMVKHQIRFAGREGGDKKSVNTRRKRKSNR